MCSLRPCDNWPCMAHKALHDRPHHHDFLGNYVDDLDQVIDMHAVRDAIVLIGVDPLGWAGTARSAWTCRLSTR